MASWDEIFSDDLDKRDGDAPTTSSTGLGAIDSGAGKGEEVKALRDKMVADKRVEHDVADSLEFNKKKQQNPEYSYERFAGAAVEGTKDVGRQVGSGAMDIAILGLTRTIAPERMAMEREKAFSSFPKRGLERNKFHLWLEEEKGLNKRDVYAGDKDTFADLRVEYMKQAVTKDIDGISSVRSALQEKLKADPAYFTSAGWVEDFVRMGPQVGLQVLTGVLTGGAASAALMFAQITGASVEEQLRNGVPYERAVELGMLNAAVQAPLEAIGTGPALKFLKPTKAILKKLKAATTIYTTEFLTEYLQAYPELYTTLMGKNPNMESLQLIDKFLDKALTKDFQEGAMKEGAIAALWSGVMTAPKMLSKDRSTLTPEVVGGDINKKGGAETEATTVADGRTIVTNAADSADIRTQSKADGNPSVEHLMAVDTETDLNAAYEHEGNLAGKKGHTLSDNLTVTPGQVRDQHETNASINSILEDVELDKGQTKARDTILENDNKLNEYDKLLSDAIDQGDTQRASDLADLYAKTATDTTQKLGEFTDLKTRSLEKNDLGFDPDEQQSMTVYANDINARAANLVENMKQKVAQEQQADLNTYRDSLDEPANLKKGLLVAERQAANRNKPQEKVYRELGELMDLEKQTSEEYFLTKGTKTEKLIKMKGDLQRKMLDDQSDSKATPEGAVIDQKSVDHIDALLAKKNEFEVLRDIAKTQDEEKAEAMKAQQEKSARLTSGDPKVKKSQGQKRVAAVRKAQDTKKKSATVERTKVSVSQATAKADQAKAITSRRAALKAESKAKAAEQAKIVSAKQEGRKGETRVQTEKVVASKEQTRKSKAAIISKQAAKLRKTPATPVSEDRKAELAASKQRQIDLKRQQEANKDLLDTAQLQIATPAKKKAAAEYTAAAIKIDGKVWTGQSHMQVIMNNDDLAALIEKIPAEQFYARVEKGFVDNSGKFVDRLTASDKIGLKKGEYLTSEDFISYELQQRGVVEPGKLTLKDQMGTLELLDAVESEMTEGPYAWLFSKTKAAGTRNVFTTGPGQFRQHPEVQTEYNNMKSLEVISNTYDGALRPDPETGSMRTIGGVKGLYLPNRNVAFANLMNIAKLAKNLPQAMETVVHEHIHALVAQAKADMTHSERAAFDKELGQIWKSVDREYLNSVRDNPATPDIIGNGILQIDKHGPELVTYALAHPEFAAFLDSIPASTRFRAKKSSIKTAWDALKDLVLKAVGMPSKHTEVMAVLNKHLKLGEKQVKFSKEIDGGFRIDEIGDGTTTTPKGMAQVTVTDPQMEGFKNTFVVDPSKPMAPQVKEKVKQLGIMRDRAKAGKFSKDSTSFEFGDNVTTENVTAWNKDMIDKSVSIADSVVVANEQEAAKLLGFVPPSNVPSVWIDSYTTTVYGAKGKARKKVVPAQVVFIANRIRSQEHFIAKWMHEQVAHNGLRNVFGTNTALFNRFLEQSFTLFSVKDSKLLEEIIELYNFGRINDKGRRVLTAQNRRDAAEEVIALRAEKLSVITKKGIVARMKKMIKAWLPKRFVDVKGSGKGTHVFLTDDYIMNMLEASKAQAMIGDTKAGDLIKKALNDRAPRVPMKGWKTLPKFMLKDEEYKTWVKEVIKKAPNLRKWYDNHMTTIRKNFGDDSDLFQILLAVTSPQTDVETNVQFAVDSYAYLLGKRDKPGSLYPNKLKERMDENWTTPEGMFRDLESTNFKVTEFGRALLGDEMATVGDIWMYRAFFGDPAVQNKNDESKALTKPHVVALRQKLHDLSAQLTEEMGQPVTPREVQAAVWVYVNSVQTGKDITKVADYQSGLNKPTAKYDGLTPMEWIDQMVPDHADGPLSQKMGIKKIPLAPISPLAKQRIQQLRLELKAKGKKTKYKVNKETGEITWLPTNTDDDIQNISDALVAGGRTIEHHGTLRGWLNETFGFVDNGDGTMTISDRALHLFKSPKTGKVSFPAIRDNLGGYSGAYTREVKFAREAADATQDIMNLDVKDNTLNAEWLRTGNDGTSVVNRIHEKRDTSARRVDRFITNLEQKFLKAFGGRKPATGPLSSGRLTGTRDTEILQRAMNLYVDSGSGANRVKAERYAAKLRRTPKLTAAKKQQLEVIDRMLNLTSGEIGWVTDNIVPYYEDYFKYAQANKLVDSHRDNYVKRIWDIPAKYKDAGISWTGGSTTGFTLTPSFGKQRTLDSVIDGWEMDMTLLQEGVLNNLRAYADELGYVMANRQFVDHMKSLKAFKKGAVMMEHDPKKNPGWRPPEGYKKLTDRGFALPGKVVYARTEVANEINKLGERPTKALWDIPFIKGLRRINSSVKSTVLSISLFHHLAGMRSYLFGVSGKKGKQWNPIRAYRRGLAELDSENGTKLQNPDYKHIAPIVDMLVSEGLTVGKTNDWEEVAGKGIVESMLMESTSTVGQTALRGWQAAGRWKKGMTQGLFGRLFAGLKAESASIEFIHKIQQKEAKLGRSLNDQEIKQTAQQVATLINADFGGLHLSRMGRNPDLQRIAQLGLLAPDWTESNWRTVTGMIPGLNKQVNRMVRDNPEIEGMTPIYQKFWGGIAARGILTTALMQAGVLALFGDEEDAEEYFDFMIDNFTDGKKFAKGRWIGVDLTTVARTLGVGNPEKRQVLSVMGHFKDILKVADLRNLARHKIAPAPRMFQTWWEGVDWKGTRFSTVNELIESGSFTADSKYAEEVSGLAWWATMPSWLGYNLRQSIPIFSSEGLQYLQGETSALGAFARAGGMDVRDVGHQSSGQRKFEEVRQEVNALDNALKVAKESRDKTLIREAREDIKEYPKFNQAKSRMNYARTQLSVVNKKIKGLEAKQDASGLTERDTLKLEKLKKRKAEIYAKFLKVINR